MRVERRNIEALLASLRSGQPIEPISLKATSITLCEMLLKLDAHVGMLEQQAMGGDGGNVSVHPPHVLGLAQQLYMYSMSPALGEFSHDFEARAKRIREDALHAASIFFEKS